MTLKVNISPLLFVLIMILAESRISNANMVDTQKFTRGLENFGVRLFTELAEKNPHKNIVFSPFSIQTCLAMARMGAEGETADQIDKGLTSSAQNPEVLANNYHAVLEKYQNSSIIKMANKIYAMQGYEIQDKFNELLTKQFYSSVDSLNFAQNVAAAQTINSWVERKTNNLIQNLVDPSLLDEFTRLVLVNAIHFKGNWVHQFKDDATREKDFYLDGTRSIKVQMMHIKENFNYADLPDFDATALEMPYKDSDLSMLIILPNSRTGLVALEEKLKATSLSDITQRLSSEKVIVDMPKFKAEFQAELSEPLSKLGMKRMFTGAAQFGKMLKSGEGLQISSVIHKAFIEVNERGTEAAAATGSLIRAKRSLTNIIEFNIEHPFVFQILHKTSSEKSTLATNIVLFAGKIESIADIDLSSKIKDEL